MMETHQVGKKLGITSVTLRLWERRGWIKPVKKDARGWREWREQDVEQCRKLMAKLHGRSPREERL